jgi:hypothetical protein
MPNNNINRGRHNRTTRNAGGNRNIRRRSRFQRVSELLLPSRLGELGDVGVAELDLSPQLVGALKAYDTTGNSVWKVRMPYNAFGAITQTALAETDATFYFALSSSGNGVDYTNVFDQYRIEAVEIIFSPRLSNGSFPSGAVSPRLYTVIDYDDASAATIAQLVQYQTCITVPPGCGVVRSCVPHVAIAAYASGAFTSFANMSDQWLDCASAAIQHYGFKVAIEAGAAGQTVLQQYTCDAYVYCAFRNSR